MTPQDGAPRPGAPYDRSRPPRLAAWLLARRVWPDERDVILGDLEEQFHRAAASDGRARACGRYWRDTARLAWHLHARPPAVATRSRSQAMLSDDVRFAIRRLMKRPAASMASILTLAGAIGAAAATWSLLSAVLLRPLPVTAPDRLQVVGFTYPDRNGRPVAPSWAHSYTAYQPVRDSGAFDGLAAGGDWTVMVATESYPEPRAVFFASHDFFQTLGIRLPLGRTFTAADDRREAPLVAVLSDRFWRRAFEADPNVLGRAITIAGKSAMVIGVTPRRFRGLNLAEAPDLYLPLHAIAQVGSPPINFFAEPIPPARMSPTSWITIVGRLPGDGSDARAIDQLAAAMPERAAKGMRPALQPVVSAAIPTSARAALVQFTQLLAGTVGLLLLIGCLSVGMLLLLGTESRRDELAMCLALGASRLRLARGIVLEGAVLAVAGALLAPVVALLFFGGLAQFQLPGGVQIDQLELGIGGHVLFAAAASAVASSLVIAIIASGFGFARNPGDVLRRRAGATPRLTRRRTRVVLVSAQVAIAFVLLAGAGLFSRSIAAALRLNHAVDASRLVTGSFALGPHGYSPDRAVAFFDELRARIERHPGVESVGYDDWEGGMSAGGRTYVNGVARSFPSMVNHIYIDERYFVTVGQRVLRGRDFTSADGAMAPRVTIVSESFGRLLAEGGDPLGLRVRDYGSRAGEAPDEIVVVGVVPDVITSFTVTEPLVMYMPFAQGSAGTSRRLTFRTNGDPAAVNRQVLSTIKQIDPAVTAPALLTINDQLTRQMSAQRFGATVMGALGVIAAILTLLGTYVLAESMTVIRRREMGIRAALGATRRQLGSSVLRESAVLVGVGLLVGLGLAWLGAGTIRAFLFQVQPLDVLTLAGVAALILALALAVSLRPAINATRVDLAKLLRE
jgi:predicted permease